VISILILRPLLFKIDTDRTPSNYFRNSLMQTSSTPYSEPVHALLTRGKTSWREWEDYQALGFTREHIPDLIRMATNQHLIVEAEDPEFWAPIHAWRALAQLDAKEAIDPLINNFNLFEIADNDWLSDDMPRALTKLGPDCIPALAMYLIDTQHETMARISVGETLKHITEQHPNTSDQVKGILISALEAFEENEGELNGFLMGDLLDLKAVEAMPVIRRAFEAEAIDITIAGDLEDAEIELGFRDERATPSRIREVIDQKYPGLRGFREKLEQEEQRKRKQNKKDKAKKKQKRKSRKRNRRR
jgi:hypothetical protein